MSAYLNARVARQEESARRRAAAEANRQQYQQRIRSQTAESVARYWGILRDVEASTDEPSVKAEVANLSRQLRGLEELAERDPFGAREVRRKVGPRIGTLPRRSRQAVRHAERARTDRSRESDQVRDISRDADRRSEAPTAMSDDLLEVWQTSVTGWSDHLARELAGANLQDLFQRLVRSGSSETPAQIRKQVEELKVRYSLRADELRTAQEADAQEETQRIEVEELRAELQSLGHLPSETVDSLLESIPGPATEPEVFRTGVDDIRHQLDNYMSEAGKTADDHRTQDALAVYSSLQSLGFVVDPPAFDPRADEIVIRGRRTGGAGAEFRLALDSRIAAHFEGYRGRACANDLTAITDQLQDAYGISLAELEIAWQNPDDEDGQARPVEYRTR